MEAEEGNGAEGGNGAEEMNGRKGREGWERRGEREENKRGANFSDGNGWQKEIKTVTLRR